MNTRSLPVWSCCAALYVGFAALALSQQAECPFEDHQCLDQRFGAACVAVSAGADAETCSAWLTEVLQRPDIGSPDVQSLVGSTYVALAHLTADRQLGQSYLDQAEATYLQILIENPADVRILRRLSSTATTPLGRAEYLRQAVEIDPTNLVAVHDLSRALLNVGSVASTLERVAVQERAYNEADLSIERDHLNLAFSLGLSYRVLIAQLDSSDPPADSVQITAVQSRLASFLDQAREDLHWESRLSEIRREPESDPEQTAAILSFICDRHARSTFGATDCIDSVTSVADAATVLGGTDTGLRLADAVASSIRSVALDEFGVDAHDADWTERFAAATQRMMASGAETPGLYFAYSYMKPYMRNLDPDEMLTTLQRGSARFPEDPDIAVVLMGEYLERGLRDEALEQARIVWGDGPERMQEAAAYVDEWLSR